MERATPTKIGDNALRNANNPLSVGNFARHCHSAGRAWWWLPGPKKETAGFIKLFLNLPQKFVNQKSWAQTNCAARAWRT